MRVTYFDGVPGITLLTLVIPFSKGGTVPTNLFVLSPLEAVTVILLLLFNIVILSFLVVTLLPLLEGADDMDAATRVFGAAEEVLFPLPTVFGRLELDVDSEKLSDLAPPLDPPL